MLTIQIDRHRIKPETCDGTLSIDGLYICDTAEHTPHRVPTGTYRIELRFSSDAHRKVPTLIPTDDCHPALHDCGPIIKVGNGVYTIGNQILVGRYLAPGIVIHSYDAFLPLYDRINNAQRRGHNVMARIIET